MRYGAPSVGYTKKTIECFSKVPYIVCMWEGKGEGRKPLQILAYVQFFCTKDVARMYSNPISNCVGSALVITKKQKTSTPHGPHYSLEFGSRYNYLLLRKL